MQWNALSSLGKHYELYKRAWSRGLAVSGRCWICAGSTLEGRRLCRGCEGDLPFRASPLLKRKFAGVELAFAPLRYEFPVTNLVKAAKFSGDLCALAILRDLLVQSAAGILRGSEVDALVPVPLSAARFAWRGFNQAGELARGLSALSGIPTRHGWLRRRQLLSTPQSTLTASERRENVAQTFAAVDTDLSGLRVALIDDVLTTGATCSAAALALRGAGVLQVIVVAAAATPLSPT